MRSYFTWSGKSSAEMGLTINSVPDFSTGQRVISKTQVPGRSGDLVFDTGAYANTTQSYDVWFKAGSMGTAAAARAVATWLLRPQGYQRLEDSYDPEVYRMAVFTGPVEVENWLQKYGRASLQFDCQPQRWIKSGQTPIDTPNGTKLYNEWAKARPLLQVTGNGTIQIGTAILHVTGTSGTFFIDCDTQNVYQGANNLNGHVQAVDHIFPTLLPGETLVSTTGVIALKIIPRWWTL